MNSYKMPLCGVNLWGSERLVFLFTKWEITYSYRVTELCGKVTKRLRAASNMSKSN